MTWILAALAAAVVLFLVLGFHKSGGWTVNKKQFLAVFGLLFVIPSMLATVPTGHTGIQTLFGQVQDGTLEAGLHVKNPFVEVVAMDNRAQKAALEMICYTSDIQEVTIVYTMNYQIEKTNAQTIYKTIGKGYYETLMQPRILECVKSVIANYNAESLIASRDELSVKITEKLEQALGVYNIIVINTAIEDMDFSDAFTQAVEEKQVAEQMKLKAQIEQQQMLLEAEAKAQQQKIQAEADAAVAKVKAEADAEVAKVKADAEKYAGEKEAEMNEKLAQSLTKELLEYYYAERWDGKLPTIVGGDGVLPVIGDSILSGDKAQ